MTKRRATQLDVDEVRALDHWCTLLRGMFPTTVGVIHVGSSIVRPDYRDVDIRVVLLDDEHAALVPLINRLDLHMLLSQWGRQMTGLRIDCQLQSVTESSEQHDKIEDGAFPHARGLIR